MELEYFCRHGARAWNCSPIGSEERLKFYEDIGLSREKLKVLDVPADERAHYSKGTYDIEYEFPFGTQELEGVAYRTDYDLKQHQEHSGKPLEYFDDEKKGEVHPARRRAERGCGSYCPGVAVRSVRRGNHH